MAVPWVWVSGTAVASLLAFWVTRQLWVMVSVGMGFMVLAAWHTVKLLATLRHALGQAVKQRTALEQALHRSQRMEALGRLAVGIAHDFNNHLTVISSNVEMTARRLDGDQERLLRYTDAALQGVQRAAVLTGRLLSFSHQPPPEPEAVDVGRLLGGVADLLRRTLGDRIVLEVAVSDAPWLTWADMIQMENALLSLTVNATDQVRDGAKLTIGVSNAHQDAAAHDAHPRMRPGDYVQIAINDSAEPRHWLPAGDAVTPDLSMAQAFACEAGGCLLRSDATLGGVSLRLLLPRYVPKAVALPVSRRDPCLRPTILVVEDDDAVRAACVEALREVDYHVLEAPDAMEAFRLIADHGGIDLLFTDLGLPGGVTGRALADAARHVDSRIRVLFTSGYEHGDVTDLTGTVLLRKPFNSAQLASLIRQLLTEARPEDSC